METSEACFKNDAHTILESAPDLYLILTADFKIIGMSQTYLKATKTNRKKLLGLNIFDVFTNNPKALGTIDITHLRESLSRVLINKTPDTMTILPPNIHQSMSDERYKNCHWSVLNTPVLDKKNKVKYIIHRIVDVTPFVQEGKLSKNMAEEIHQYVVHIDEINKKLSINEKLHQSIIEAIPDAMLIINQEGVITKINYSLEILFGYKQEELLGQKMEILIPEPYRSKHPTHREHYFKSPRIRPMGNNMDLFGQHKNGTIFSTEISLSPLTTIDGLFAIAMIRDTTSRVLQTKLLQTKDTELMEANAKLKIEKDNLSINNQKMLVLTQFSETLAACKDIDEVILAVSSYTTKLLDFSCGALYLFDSSHKYLEVKARWGNLNTCVSNFTTAECWGLRRGMIHEISSNQPGVSCEHIKNPQQELSYICLPVMMQNEIFGLIYLEIATTRFAQSPEWDFIINMTTKIIAAAIANINLRNLFFDQSIRDSLTGLYNRRFLDDYLLKQISLAKRYNEHLAVIMFDIDDFKKINDTYGHETGDFVLEKLGHTMAHLKRI